MVKEAVQEYYLEFAKRGATVSYATVDKTTVAVLTRDEDRYSKVREVPVGFKGFFGTYEEVAKEAKRLNNLQETAGFSDHIYYPEPLGSSCILQKDITEFDAIVRA